MAVFAADPIRFRFLSRLTFEKGDDIALKVIKLNRACQILTEILAEIPAGFGLREIGQAELHSGGVGSALLGDGGGERTQPQLGHGQLRGEVGDGGREQLCPLGEIGGRRARGPLR